MEKTCRIAKSFMWTGIIAAKNKALALRTNKKTLYTEMTYISTTVECFRNSSLNGIRLILKKIKLKCIKNNFLPLQLFFALFF